MKKVSLLILTIISFLFVGMMMPNAYAAEDDVDISLNVVTKDNNGDAVIALTQFSVTYGNTMQISTAGLNLEAGESAILVYNGEFVPLNTDFVMSQSLNLSIIVKETVESVEDYVAVFVDTNGEVVDVQYNPSEAPTYNGVPLSKPGYGFDGFNTVSITSDQIFTANYSLTPDNTVMVTVDGATAVVYNYNDVVTVSTELPGFTHWEDEFGFVVSYDRSFSFTALNDISITPVTTGTEGPNIYLRDVSGISTLGDSFLARLHLPDGYQLIEYGFLGSNSNLEGQYEPVIGGTGVSKFTSKSMNNDTNEFLVTIPGEGFAYTRTFAVIKNTTTNQIETIYSFVRNSIDVTFRINYGWEHNFTGPILGAYVRSDFNNWGLTQKMDVDQDSNYTNYYLTINHRFIGTSLNYYYKYFIYVPSDWSSNDGWEGPEMVNDLEYRYRWYGSGWIEVSPGNWQDPNYSLSINPELGPSQFSTIEPHNH